MKNDNRSVIFGVGAITILLLSYFILMYNPDRYDWTESYETQTEDDKVKKPYAATIIYQMLQGYFSDNKLEVIEESLVNSLPLEEGIHSNYVFIGKRPYYDSIKVDRLLDFAAIGNSVFISSGHLPKELVKRITAEKCLDVNQYHYNENGEEVGNSEDEETILESTEIEELPEDIDRNEEKELVEYFEKKWSGYDFYRDTMTHVNFTHNNLFTTEPTPYKYKQRYSKQKYHWSYIDDQAFCEGELDYAELSYLEPHRVNFIKISYLKGFIYLHTTPLMFTDFQMVREEAFASAGKVFSHLPEGDIYWDTVSKTQGGVGNFPGRNSDWTPLQYLLSQRSLKWSWYLLLSMFGLYLMFRAKRKQRIIPVLEQNKNTSLEFIKTVGRLYFLQNDHRKLSGQKMKLFLSFVRDHYSIPTQNINSEMKERLANKSEIPLTLIEEIFSRYQRIQRAPEVSTSHLVNFHFAVEDFYKKCK